MTYGAFNFRRQFAERFVVFDDFKERIVSESVCSARFKEYATAADFFDFKRNGAIGIGENHVARVMRAAFVDRNVA